MEKLKIENTEKGFETFLKISVYLTGFGENELLATGMHETYYYTIMKEPDQDNVRAYFNDAQLILDEHTGDEKSLIEQIGSRLFPPSDYLDLSRRIILLWYTGIWTTIQQIGVKLEKTSIMVNAEAYKRGLIWTAAQTHPAGAEHTGYDSWSNPPL